MLEAPVPDARSERVKQLLIVVGFLLVPFGPLVLLGSTAAGFEVGADYGFRTELCALAALPLGTLLVALSWRRTPRRWIAAGCGMLLAPAFTLLAGRNRVAAWSWESQCARRASFSCVAAGDLYASGIGIREDKTKATVEAITKNRGGTIAASAIAGAVRQASAARGSATRT